MNLTQNAHAVPQYGVFEFSHRADANDQHPIFDIEFNATFTRPNGSTVTTEGFYDGKQTYKTRAYADTPGEWQWVTQSNLPDLNNQSSTLACAGGQQIRQAPGAGDWVLWIQKTA